MCYTQSQLCPYPPPPHPLPPLPVLRSADGTRWWKDGSGDFSVPLPFKAAEAEMGAASPDLAQDKVAMVRRGSWG